MPIDFCADRWNKIRQTYSQWWAGKLDRPIIPVLLYGKDPGRPQPNASLLSQATCADFSISPEDLIDRIDYELSQYGFLGDAYPYFNMDCFGPGVIAALLGGKLDNSTGQVWFHPPDDVSICKLHFKFDPDNVWFRRIKDIYTAGMVRWQGQVLMGMTDLGGNLDILSTFRPSEKLLFDLYDHPEEVKRLTWEAHVVWHEYYEVFNQVLQPHNPGYSDWSYIYSDKPSYMLQCDLSYMINPAMFDEFVKPELAATCKRLPRSFYHLDGVGQLGHLDSLLEVEQLNGVQWIPGDGKPNCVHWPEVYQKIHAAGKLIQVIDGEFDILDTVIDQLGTGQGIHVKSIMTARVENEKDIRNRLQLYGLE
jgi:5-methyltetrahydrofolate--homocysteine methyltransferase